jgi:hypothetical protein
MIPANPLHVHQPFTGSIPSDVSSLPTRSQTTVKEGRNYSKVDVNQGGWLSQMATTIYNAVASVFSKLGSILSAARDTVQGWFSSNEKKVEKQQGELPTASQKADHMGRTTLNHEASEISNPQEMQTKKVPGTVRQARPIGTTMTELENQYADLGPMAHSITSSKKMPKVSLSANESKEFGKAQKKVKELESHLLKKYGSDFASVGWHGRTSFQRIVWQDPKFVKAIQDPLVVKAIFINAANKQEGNLAGNTLSNLMLYGLGGNRLSYLISVSPNWDSKPSGVTWDKLSDMGLLSAKSETPRKVSSEYLEDVGKALASLKNVLSSSSGISSVEASPQVSTINRQINNASLSDLLNAFTQLVNDDTKIRGITLGVAGPSTEPNRMAGQCYEVMSTYSQLLELNKGDHAAVLGYGLVSHALDARHLAAALYVSANPASSYVKQIQDRYGDKLEEGKQALMQLIDDAKNGKLDEEASNLLKVRLQQIMTIVASSTDKLGITPQDVSSALGQPQA